MMIYELATAHLGDPDKLDISRRQSLPVVSRGAYCWLVMPAQLAILASGEASNDLTLHHTMCEAQNFSFKGQLVQSKAVSKVEFEYIFSIPLGVCVLKH